LQDDFYVISIKDEGIGIAKSNFKSIFEKFYRVTEDKNIHTNKGLGLGLYLSSKNINELGGVINLESEIGKGSTFFIKIPVNEN
jgi:signal transduction histidine kinase